MEPPCGSCEPDEPNEPDNCDEEALEQCLRDAKHSLSKCTEKYTKIRDAQLEYCERKYKECMETVENLEFPWRQFFEYACYKAWNVACVGIVWKAWGMNMVGCFLVWRIDVGECYREYCPQPPFPEIY